MKRITIELSPQSCADAIKALNQYRQSLDRKYMELCRRLAKVGADEAQRWFDQAAAEGNGGTAVGTVPIQDGWAITANGTKVYFVEFGTGDQVAPHYASNVPIVWGSWSVTHAQRLWNYGYWYYQKERYEGTPAYMPMYHAEQKIRAEELRIAKDVFR